ncbi:MAG TPA: GNAT family N-acetyltransferase [Fulvivirga sp.]|nr:GNAT family N-acetyltransferase [Fulvivirga sp.]
MEIKHTNTDSKGRFYIEDEEGLAAEMTYSIAGQDKIIIDHTEVAERLRGKKVGNLLVEAAVSFAREKNIKILPLCPFAKRVMEKNNEYSDVL